MFVLKKKRFRLFLVLYNSVQKKDLIDKYELCCYCTEETCTAFFLQLSHIPQFFFSYSSPKCARSLTRLHFVSSQNNTMSSSFSATTDYNIRYKNNSVYHMVPFHLLLRCHFRYS